MILVSGRVAYLAWSSNLVSASSWSDDRSSKSSHTSRETHTTLSPSLYPPCNDQLLIGCQFLFAYLANLTHQEVTHVDLILWVPDVLAPLFRDRSRRTIYTDL